MNDKNLVSLSKKQKRVIAIMWSASKIDTFQMESFYDYGGSGNLATEKDAGDIVSETQGVALKLAGKLPILGTLEEIIDYAKANF